MSRIEPKPSITILTGPKSDPTCGQIEIPLVVLPSNRPIYRLREELQDPERPPGVPSQWFEVELIGPEGAETQWRATYSACQRVEHEKDAMIQIITEQRGVGPAVEDVVENMFTSEPTGRVYRMNFVPE